MSTVILDDEFDPMDEEAIDALVELGSDLVTAIMERKPLQEVKDLIDSGAPLWFQDDEGNTALHAAAYSEDPELVRYLIEKGSVWNAVDILGNTAGDISLSLNDGICYRLIRDAGIRSEFLLSQLSSHGATLEAPSSIILRTSDTTAAASTQEFLQSRLTFTIDRNGQDVCLVNVGEEQVGVMMGWEKEIMEETVKRLCTDLPGEYTVLNVGFGLGIIDSLFQSQKKPPKKHYIIEAHPDVLQHMRQLGWYEKSGVTILEGRWQEFISNREVLPEKGFDVIYTDTFSEKYEDLRAFFKHVPRLMSGSQARFSFFNGLGATNALFYDVYTQVSELDLSRAGISLTWSDVDVVGDDATEDKWSGTRTYFGLRFYRLPIGRLK